MSNRYFIEVKKVNTAPDFWRDTTKGNKSVIMAFVVLIIIGIAWIIIMTLHSKQETVPPNNSVTTEVPNAKPRVRQMFAHYYFSHTLRYSQSPDMMLQFKCDIEHAIEAKLDGFIVRVGNWEPNNLHLMYQAASSVSNFKLFINLDFSYIPKEKKDARHIISLFKRNFDSEAQFKIDNRPVLGIYRFEDVNFGENDSATGWTKHFIRPLKEQNISVYLMAQLQVESEDSLNENFFKETSFVDAYQLFNAWPTGGPYDKVNYDIDRKLIKYAHAKNKKVMSSVSPCYFAHFSMKNKIRRSEDTWRVRWDDLLQNDADFGQIVSWNGFHESHAVGPINPYSSVGEYDWYKDMSNEAFTKMLPFYVEWFQTRDMPDLTENVIFFYHRPHSKETSRVRVDRVSKPENWENAKDAFVVTAFIKDQGEYNVSIYFEGKGRLSSFIIKDDDSITYREVNFDIRTGNVTLAVTRRDVELNRTRPTELIDLNSVDNWNFNFNSRFITFKP